MSWDDIDMADTVGGIAEELAEVPGDIIDAAYGAQRNAALLAGVAAVAGAATLIVVGSKALETGTVTRSIDVIGDMPRHIGRATKDAGQGIGAALGPILDLIPGV